MTPHQVTDPVRDRVRRLFEFLKRFDERRSPARRDIAKAAWSLALVNLPRHPSVQIGSGQTDEPLLQIDRPALTACPEPPAALREWLLAGWKEPERQVEVQSSLARERSKGGEVFTVVERFEERADRVAELGRWKAVRDAWVEAEQPAREASALFQDVFSLWSRLQREGESLRVYLGDANLIWQPPGDPNGAVNHPLILLEVELVFDEKKRQLTFVEADRPPAFYSQLLSTFEDLAGQARRLCRDIVEQSSEDGGCHPLAGATTDAVVAQLGGVLNVVEIAPSSEELRAPDERRVLQRRAILFAIPPLVGLQAACDALLEALPNLAELPQALAQIVGQHEKVLDDGGGEGAETTPDGPIDLFFTKPANEAQREIARRLATARTVLVQGPPGTGKTHTIANLIGHHLAQGHRVLVTAATTKALRVLRDKVTPPLQPLCVSVLDSDMASRSELEHAVNGIVTKLTETVGSFDKNAEGQRQQRKQMLETIAGNERDLRTALSREYEEILTGTVSLSPSKAAEHVAERGNLDAWLPGPIAPQAPLPLDEAEVAELYRLTHDLRAADEALIHRGLPDPGALPSADQFAEFVSALQQPPPPEPTEPLFRDGLTVERGQISQMSVVMREASDSLQNAGGWQLACAEAGLMGNAHREAWDSLLGLIDEVGSEAPILSLTADEHEVTLKFDNHEAAQETCGEILAHLERGGGLSWFSLLGKGAWSSFLESVTVRGRRPATAADFHAADAALRLEVLRGQLRRRWKAVMVPAGHPLPDEHLDAPERYATALAREVRQSLEWSQEVLEPCIELAEQTGVSLRKLIHRTSSLPPYAEVRRALVCLANKIIPALDFEKDRLDRLALSQQMEQALAVLPSFPWLGPARDAWAALRARDVGAYASALEQLWRFWNICPAAARRAELLVRLAKSAKAWAGAVQARAAGHQGPGVPGEAAAGWLYRQLLEELLRRDALDADTLQRKLVGLRDQLALITAQLVENLAWGAQVRRTKPEEQHALMSWVGTVRRIGKGTGNQTRVQELRRAAQRHIEVARGAVPVWIMPLSRVFESFKPGEASFDVVILDEASQCDVRAIAAMILGKRVIVVGDDEQVSPMDVGGLLGEMTALQDEYLYDFPDRATFDGKTSAYEIARKSFPGGLVRLVEHFRCVPDIIGFSNALSYKGEIKPLREASDAKVFPATVAHRVLGGERGHDEKTNRIEALEVASLVVAACEVPEYDGLSIGVVGLLGDHQAKEIETLLQRFVDAGEYKRRRIICGSAAHFQGDERDVMFLSMVYSSKPEGPHVLQEGDDLKRRYNVAASRARDQMWIVHSLDPDRDLKPADVRRRLLVHAQDPRSSRVRQNQERTESDFERRVLNALVEKGYRVRSQVEVGAFRLDLVVEGARHRVAVECDGDRYHPIEQLDADLARQAILERLGWRFIRVRGSAYYRDPAREMRRVYERLKDANVLPLGPEPARAASTALTKSVQAVLARAAELREQWLAGGLGIDHLFENLDGGRRRRWAPRFANLSSEVGTS